MQAKSNAQLQCRSPSTLSEQMSETNHSASSSVSETSSTPRSSSLVDTTTNLLQVKGHRSVRSTSSSQAEIETPNLTDKDIDDIVLFLLEKLNTYTDHLNQLSNTKESHEQQVKSLNRQLYKQTSRIKTFYGNQALAVVEIYFEKMLRICMRELELRHCLALQSDVEDELIIVGNTIERFDFDSIEENNHLDTKSNIFEQSHDAPDQLKSISNVNSTAKTTTNRVCREIVEKMRLKMKRTCEQLCSLYDKVGNLKTRYNQDRISFDRFCELKRNELRIVMPFCQEYFDTRLKILMLKPKLEKFTTKIDRIRRAYAMAMKDLYVVSCYIHQLGAKTKEEAVSELNSTGAG